MAHFKKNCMPPWFENALPQGGALAPPWSEKREVPWVESGKRTKVNKDNFALKITSFTV